MQITNITEAKASLSKLIKKVMSGEEVIIGKAGIPVAKPVPSPHPRSRWSRRFRPSCTRLVRAMDL
jgi:antitoxin (DNA-binding transcriptional repressor) of toxin-antitoxin stability system